MVMDNRQLGLTLFAVFSALFVGSLIYIVVLS
jgi:hypothetical protein